MPVHNSEIAEMFVQTANFLELDGSNPFRIRAYRKAAQNISSFTEDLEKAINKGDDLTKIPGIGKDLAEKIKTIIQKGKLPILENLKNKFPEELNKLMKIRGLGPKRVKELYKELKIGSLKDLKEAANQNKIRKLRGFGKKTEKMISEGLKQVKQQDNRKPLAIILEIINPFIEYLNKKNPDLSFYLAGSCRRKKETIGDADILTTGKFRNQVMESFVSYEDVIKINSQGKTKSSVVLRAGFQVDLRYVKKKSLGAALVYFTGSKAHNVKIRKMARKRKLKINEYGVYKGKKPIAGKTEKDVYQSIGLSYIQPELRENRGEIEAAQKNKLPSLISLDQIKGDLHTHTKTTDGAYTLKEMAQAAKAQGYQYIANTEHSKSSTITHGLNENQLEEQILKIDELNKKIDGIRILKSIEVDILEDGSLDLPNSILKELDLRVCSIHSYFNLSRKKQTRRILKAMENPYFNILGHPTGRKINKRKPYDVNMNAIIKQAKATHRILEINASFDRLDLNAFFTKAAKEESVKMAISTDAHTTEDLKLMTYGINQARRGWLEPDDVINTMDFKNLKKYLRRS